MEAYTGDMKWPRGLDCASEESRIDRRLTSSDGRFGHTIVKRDAPEGRLRLICYRSQTKDKHLSTITAAPRHTPNLLSQPNPSFHTTYQDTR